ncbi:unnamed protein product [Closterium sp. Naga37s-1]|nr:unnamed protein product [Closterium sp. Naga37s-1]
MASRKKPLSEQLAELLTPAPTAGHEDPEDAQGFGAEARAIFGGDESAEAGEGWGAAEAGVVRLGEAGADRKRGERRSAVKEKGLNLRGNLVMEGREYGGNKSSRSALFDGWADDVADDDDDAEDDDMDDDVDERMQKAGGAGEDDDQEGEGGSEEEEGEEEGEDGEDGQDNADEDEDNEDETSEDEYGEDVEDEALQGSEDELEGGALLTAARATMDLGMDALDRDFEAALKDEFRPAATVAGRDPSAGNEDDVDEDGERVGHGGGGGDGGSGAPVAMAKSAFKGAVRDEDKGRAVAAQRALWDRALELRIALQRPLQSACRLPHARAHAAFAAVAPNVAAEFQAVAAGTRTAIRQLLTLQDELFTRNAAVDGAFKAARAALAEGGGGDGEGSGRQVASQDPADVRSHGSGSQQQPAQSVSQQVASALRAPDSSGEMRVASQDAADVRGHGSGSQQQPAEGAQPGCLPAGCLCPLCCPLPALPAGGRCPPCTRSQQHASLKAGILCMGLRVTCLFRFLFPACSPHLECRWHRKTLLTSGAMAAGRNSSRLRALNQSVSQQTLLTSGAMAASRSSSRLRALNQSVSQQVASALRAPDRLIQRSRLPREAVSVIGAKSEALAAAFASGKKRKGLDGIGGDEEVGVVHGENGYVQGKQVEKEEEKEGNKKQQEAEQEERGEEQEGEEEEGQEGEQGEQEEQQAEQGGEHSEWDMDSYDDTEFYQQLLREFLDSSHLEELGIASQQVVRRLRGSKGKAVDRRASKGRKVRYALMPALVNFMAAEPVQLPPVVERLFGNLFGQVHGKK